MLQRQYGLGGLDLRTNKLLKDDSKCTDCSNVLLDNNKNLVKRDGTSHVVVTSGTDLMYYSASDQSFSYTGALLNLATGLSAFSQGTYPIAAGTTTLDYVEYNDILYYNDNSGNYPLFKYDGYMWSLAGLPKSDSIVNTIGTGTASFVRIAPYVIDLRGNVIWGDYTQLNINATGNSLDIIWDDALDSCKQHFNKYSKIQTTDVLTSTNQTIAIDPTFGHNYVANIGGNDYVRLQDINGDWHVLKVTSIVNNTSITLEIPAGLSFNITAGEPVESRAFIQVFTSVNETYGYYTRSDAAFLFDMGNKDLAGNKLAVSAQPAIILTGGNSLDIPMEELYDTSVFRGLPPRCKYLTLFNESLVMGNRRDSDAVYNQQSSTLHQSIFWSSVQLLQGGTSIENFPPENAQQVGNTGEGQLTAVSGASDSLIIGKERQIYYLNGVFQDLSYRIWSALTENIGIVSSRSIVTISGVTIFMSDKGLYLASKGSTPKEMSDLIEPLFLSGDYDLTKTRCMKDHKNERLVISLIGIGSISDKILIFDYYYKEWFLWDGLSIDRGILVNPDGSTYFQGESSLFAGGFVTKLDSTTLQDEIPTTVTPTLTKNDYTASWSSNWFHFGNPSLKNKLTKVVFISTYGSDFLLNLKEQINWVDTDKLNIDSISLGPSNPSGDRKLLASKAYSFRLKLESPAKEALSIDGFELEYTGDQTTPKGNE